MGSRLFTPRKVARDNLGLALDLHSHDVKTEQTRAHRVPRHQFELLLQRYCYRRDMPDIEVERRELAQRQIYGRQLRYVQAFDAQRVYVANVIHPQRFHEQGRNLVQFLDMNADWRDFLDAGNRQRIDRQWIEREVIFDGLDVDIGHA